MERYRHFWRTRQLCVGINGKGQVVGAATLAGNPRQSTVLFSTPTERCLISTHLSIRPSAGALICARAAINDSGQIACIGLSPDAKIRAVLLTPLEKKKIQGDRETRRQGDKERRDEK